MAGWPTRWSRIRRPSLYRLKWPEPSSDYKLLERLSPRTVHWSWRVATVISPTLGPARRSTSPQRPPWSGRDAACFQSRHPDGRQIATAAADGLVRIWTIATVELPDDRGAVKLWVQVLTGMELDAEGNVRLLDQETWGQRRRALAAHGDFR
jgi:WD40 repeat protein